MLIVYCHFSRTLTSVYDAILEDLVFPAEIVGKRIRVKLDGKQIIKVHLDKSQQTNIEHKVIIWYFIENLFIPVIHPALSNSLLPLR